MTYISIDPVTLVHSCSRCGMPVPKTVAEVITCMSMWPIICQTCKAVAREIRYLGECHAIIKAS